MEVLTPVGRFPLRIVGAHLAGDGLRVETRLGAWRSTIAFERADRPLAACAVAILAGAFLLGRASGRRSRGRRSRA
jgi:hypothetical protein